MIRSPSPTAWLAVCLFAFSCGSQAPDPVACGTPPTRGHAACNAGLALKEAAYDAIPVPDADGTCIEGREFYVVYSYRDADVGLRCEPNTSAENNVGIFVLPLAPARERNRVLLFGAGYGDHCMARYGAACDAGWVDYVLRNELGFEPATTDLEFAAPHGHFDHVNPEFLRALQAIGYGPVRLVYHELEGLIEPDPQAECEPQVVQYPGPTIEAGEQRTAMDWSGVAGTRTSLSSAEAERLVYAVERDGQPLGTATFLVDPGHGCGALDLFLEFRPGHSIAVRGSNQRNVAPEGELVFDLAPHGNVVVPELPGCDCP